MFESRTYTCAATAGSCFWAALPLKKRGMRSNAFVLPRSTKGLNAPPRNLEGMPVAPAGPGDPERGILRSPFVGAQG